MPRFASVILCMLPCTLAAACGADAGPSAPEAPHAQKQSPQKQTSDTEPQSSAVEDAYAALTAGSRDQVVQVIGDVDALVDKEPENGRAVFYSGIMRLWQLGEKLELSENPADQLTESQTAIDRLAKARDLLPNDDRTPGFLGLARVTIGHIVGNSDLVNQGMSDLNQGIAIFPAYTHFLAALINDGAPAESDDFTAALGHAQAVMDTCQALKDSSGAYKYRKGPLPASLRVCNDDGIVPHVWEGFFVTYGDMLVKAGRVDDARAMYQSVTHAPRFADWPFVSALQDRMDSAEQRAALYADADPTNDPALWNDDGHVCTGCHQDHP